MEAKSLGDLLRTSCQKWGQKPAMLYPDKDGFQAVSYRELLDRVRAYAGVIKSFGLKRGDRVCLQSESCIDWALFDWGCQSLGVVLVPIYPTLPPDQTQYIVKDCGAGIVVASSAEQAEKSQGLSNVRVILLRKSEDSVETLAQKNPDAMSVEEFNASIDATNPDDMATIIYTSGTTGVPKGAMLSHRNFTFICEAALKSLPFNETDTFLSFLPMSHVYERVAGQALPISAGATIAYSKSLMALAHDMAAVKPTIMLCVPRFLEATRDRIMDNAAKGSFVSKTIFNAAVSQGLKKANGGFAPLAGLLGAIVGKKIRARTGGKIRFFVSGGAALPTHVSAFYHGFGITILQGYGLTETAAATCVNHPDKNRPWTVGPPIPGVEVRLAPDGEILVRGPSRMIGYYNLPQETAECIDKDGWFSTGDIGQFEDGYLKITDRKKDLLVLANGKKVAPQPIENRLRESSFITEAVLFGDQNEFVYALVIPTWDRLRTELNSSETISSLVENEKVKQIIKAEVDKINKGLADFEKIKKHTILATEFSIETGELTPSLKVKRKYVREKYASTIQNLLEPKKE